MNKEQFIIVYIDNNLCFTLVKEIKKLMCANIVFYKCYYGFALYLSYIQPTFNLYLNIKINDK